jgi:uncharacterized membrane protein YkvA (DUF1232 family)
VSVVLAVLASLLVMYAALLVALLIARPSTDVIREAMRLLPDVLRLVRRLAADASVARAARIRLWLLLGYLAMPFDLVPDFIPVVGYADDAVLVSLVLRSVIRRAGVETVRGHWPGTPAGLQALGRLTGLNLRGASE